MSSHEFIVAGYSRKEDQPSKVFLLISVVLSSPSVLHLGTIASAA